MKKGKYIVVEGGDGAGKDTQVELLRKEFGEENFIFTREPGGTRLGKALREMLLFESCGAVTLSAELFLFLGDRAQHVEEIIKPALAQGKHVISNRSWISFLAYQIYGRQQLSWKPVVEQSLVKIFEGVQPDLVVMLDVSPEVGHERQRAMGKTLDIMEQMSQETHERIRQAFLEIVRGMPQAKIVDASRSREEVWTDVKAAVQSVV